MNVVRSPDSGGKLKIVPAGGIGCWLDPRGESESVNGYGIEDLEVGVKMLSFTVGIGTV